jgi:hypothetical protein
MDQIFDDIFELNQLAFDTVKKNGYFNNPVLLLSEVEKIIRTKRKNIINNPHHICNEKCNMKNENVYFYRISQKKVPIYCSKIETQITNGEYNNNYNNNSNNNNTNNNNNNNNNLQKNKRVYKKSDIGKQVSNTAIVISNKQEKKILNTEQDNIEKNEFRENFFNTAIENNEEYGIHICVPDVCDHLVEGHKCQDMINGEQCPHNIHYKREDIKKIPFLFSCTNSGNLHVCGPNCTNKISLYDTRDMLTCPLTGICLGVEISNQLFGGGIQQYMGLGYGESDHEVKKGETHNKILAIDQQYIQQRSTFVSIAKNALKKLLFSEQRQKEERKAELAQSKLFDSASYKIVKKSRQKNNKSSAVLFDLVLKYDSLYKNQKHKPLYSNFFKNMFPDLTCSSSSSSSSNLCSFQTLISENPISVYDKDISNCQSRIERVWKKLVVQSKYNYHIINRNNIREKICDFVANSTANIYQNLSTCARDSYSNFYKYTEIFLVIIYMMKDGVYIPSSQDPGDNISNSCKVTVIPKVPFLQFLPKYKTIMMYDEISAYSPIEDLCKCQKAILSMFTNLAINGVLYNYKVDDFID